MMARKNVFGNFYCIRIFPYIFLKNTEDDVNWALTLIETFILWSFRLNTPEYYGKITRCDSRKDGESGEGVFIIVR